MMAPKQTSAVLVFLGSVAWAILSSVAVVVWAFMTYLLMKCVLFAILFYGDCFVFPFTVTLWHAQGMPDNQISRIFTKPVLHSALASIIPQALF